MAWNPWRALRDRGAEVHLVFADLGGRRGTWHRDQQGDLIVIDASLDRRTRRAVLAHELIHSERGIGHPSATASTMQREEAWVRRETARRLVPPDELLAFVARQLGVGAAVTIDVVADEFDVPLDVAELACLLLPPDPHLPPHPPPPPPPHPPPHLPNVS